MPEPYYDYTTNPVTQTNPNSTGHWESIRDWPKTFQYVAKTDFQGLHPPAPVYQTNQPAQQAMYFAVSSSCHLHPTTLTQLQGNTTSPAGYYLNGAYYGSTAPSAPAGWPYTSYSSCYSPYTSASPLTYYNYSQISPYSAYNYPYKYSPYYTAPSPFGFPAASPWATSPWAAAASPWATSPWGASPWGGGAAQAAAAVAANTAIAQLPSSPYYFVGSSAAEIQAQNAIIAAQFMAAGQLKGPPNQLVPYKPGNSPQFWCKELDGSWTLRELSDFTSGDLTAGRWEVHPTSGYHYFVKAVA